MKDLDDLKKQREKLHESIKIMKDNLMVNREKMAEYDSSLLKAEELGYDEEVLERGLSSIAMSIGSIEKVLAGEQARLQELDTLIQGAEAILKAHKICVHQKDHGDHDWEILAMFDNLSPHAGQWSKRKCRFCETEQRLGYE